MGSITNDAEFKQTLQGLDAAAQRVIAAKFVEHVLALSDDDRIKRVVKVALDSSASAAEISDALKVAKSAIMDSSTRCGAEGNWTDQAGYFVARAAVAVTTPQAQSQSGSSAWQAAMSCRMARTSMLIDADTADALSNSENEWQYDLVSNYLQS